MIFSRLHSVDGSGKRCLVCSDTSRRKKWGQNLPAERTVVQRWSWNRGNSDWSKLLYTSRPLSPVIN